MRGAARDYGWGGLCFQSGWQRRLEGIRRQRWRGRCRDGELWLLVRLAAVQRTQDPTAPCEHTQAGSDLMPTLGPPAAERSEWQ